MSSAQPFLAPVPEDEQSLRTRLEEAEEMLRALRKGEVDALIVEGPGGEEVYTLRSADQPYRILVERMNEGAATLVDDGTADIYYCNERLAAMLRERLDRMVGHSFAMFLPQGQRGFFDRLVDQCRSAGHSQGESMLIAVDDTLVPVVLSLSTLPLGEVKAFALVVTDLTAYKRQEAALEQERVARSALAETERRKDEFLAMLGHELRNPLAPIISAVEVMKRTAAEGSVVRGLSELIERQAKHVAAMLDDLFEISRLVQGNARLNRQSAALSAIFAAGVELARPVIEGRRHQLSIVMPPEPLHVEVDLRRMAQVIGNLLINAAKYTDEGGVVRLIGEVNGAEARIRVADNGRGIAPDLLPRVFDPFTQGYQGPGQRAEGLGIGLAIVKRLVEMHGGRVEAHSAGPGKGSEFDLHLPITPSAALRKVSESTQAAAHRPRTYRVIIIDDNVDAADTLAMLLESQGHEVRAAYDPQAGLDAARDFQPQIALVDIELPRMNGHELAGRLREQVETRATKLIALSGYGAHMQGEHANEGRFSAYLVKPVDLEALTAAFHAVFQ